VTNTRLGATVEPYVIADGGDDRYGSNTFLGATELSQRMGLFVHASAICAATTLAREVTPELRRTLALKPRQTDFL